MAAAWLGWLKVVQSTLSPAQTAFYSTAALVIPVAALAYVVAVAALGERTSTRVDELAEKSRAAARSRIEAIMADKTNRALLATVLWDYAVETIRMNVRGALGWLMVATAALPIAGEFCALLALSGNHASHAIFVITWIGLAAMGLFALAPLWRVLTLAGDGSEPTILSLVRMTEEAKDEVNREPGTASRQTSRDAPTTDVAPTADVASDDETRRSEDSS